MSWYMERTDKGEAMMYSKAEWDFLHQDTYDNIIFIYTF